MSKTVTVNEHVAVLPEASVAVQVTTVVPVGKQEPDGGLQTTVTPGQLSEAVGGGIRMGVGGEGRRREVDRLTRRRRAGALIGDRCLVRRTSD